MIDRKVDEKSNKKMINGVLYEIRACGAYFPAKEGKQDCCSIEPKDSRINSIGSYLTDLRKRKLNNIN